MNLELSLPGRAGAARKSPFSLEQRKTLEKEIARRAEAMHLRVSSCRMERGKIRLSAILPPHLRLENVTRALRGALNGIMKRQYPHLARGDSPREAPPREIGGVPF